MNRKLWPTEIAETILGRSICQVKTGACLYDGYSVYAVGWNHMGADGMGQHAEAHCISRCNRDRLRGSTIYVAATRGRNGKAIISRPCDECMKLIVKYDLRFVWRDADGSWRTD